MCESVRYSSTKTYIFDFFHHWDYSYFPIDLLEATWRSNLTCSRLAVKAASIALWQASLDVIISNHYVVTVTGLC